MYIVFCVAPCADVTCIGDVTVYFVLSLRCSNKIKNEIKNEIFNQSQYCFGLCFIFRVHNDSYYSVFLN